MMKSKIESIAMMLLVVSSGCRSRENPDDTSLSSDNGSLESIFWATSTQIFDDDKDNSIHEIAIHMDGETFSRMTAFEHGGQACIDEAPYGHIKEFYFKNRRTGKSQIIHNAGMRVKGNTSCDDGPHVVGFKVKLNAADKIGENGKRTQKVYEKWGNSLPFSDDQIKNIKKQNLFGLEEFSLRRGGNDPTRIRDLIASDVFEFGGDLARKHNAPGAPLLGGPVFRASMAYVKIHQGGYGVLTEGPMGLLELVDEQLIASHYGEAALGNFFKIQEAKGTFLPSEMPENNQVRLLKYYEPKLIDGKEFDSSKAKQRERAAEILIGFRKLLASASDPVSEPDFEKRKEKLRSLLDIENIISYMVASNLTGHFDSLVGALSNNDYLFMHGQTKKWGIITWDLDNTFGAGNREGLWMAGIKDFNVDLKYRPLFKAVVDHFDQEYKERVKEFLSGVYGYRQMDDRITRFKRQTEGKIPEESFTLIYKFYRHRFANAWCQVYRSEKHFARIVNGEPVVSWDGLNVECDERR
jgi:hypothetical protein